MHYGLGDARALFGCRLAVDMSFLLVQGVTRVEAGDSWRSSIHGVTANKA